MQQPDQAAAAATVWPFQHSLQSSSDIRVIRDIRGSIPLQDKVI
jgi:hypothetical protein